MTSSRLSLRHLWSSIIHTFGLPKGLWCTSYLFKAKGAILAPLSVFGLHQATLSLYIQLMSVKVKFVRTFLTEKFVPSHSLIAFMSGSSDLLRGWMKWTLPGSRMKSMYVRSYHQIKTVQSLNWCWNLCSRGTYRQLDYSSTICVT